MKERFTNWEKPSFDAFGYACNKHKMPYGWRCQYHEGLLLGDKVDVGCFTYINAKYNVGIGNNVQIGAHCAIYSEDTENGTKGPVLIGENSLIGSYTLILPNSVIPPNSKIPAYSIIKYYEEKDYTCIKKNGMRFEIL